jgi:putative two-component system response regulator
MAADEFPPAEILSGATRLKGKPDRHLTDPDSDLSGYSNGLIGDAIPLAARVVAVADTDDAMRSKLVYEPGLSHATVKRLMLAPDQGQFDPALLVAFRSCEGPFKDFFERTQD